MASAKSIENSSDTQNPQVFVVIPVFNRVHYTLKCIELLKAQTYDHLVIIVSDGGSTDETLEKVHTVYPDVVLLTTQEELWWTGAMAAGIEYALKASNSEHDCVLMMNNDTEFPSNYVETLLHCSIHFDAAVGALIVDSRDTDKILDAGEYVRWSPYSFPVKTEVGPEERFCDNVDVLPGRGSLVPLKMIRAVGNVDANRFPHYLADYEFFYRLKSHGFRLGVCYETRIHAHIEETGIVPGSGVDSFASVWREMFSRRSMNNFVDHWRFVSLHAPAKRRLVLRLALASRVLVYLGLRTPLRPIVLAIFWFVLTPVKVARAIRGQIRMFRYFTSAIHQDGKNVFCDPAKFPGSVRAILYLLMTPAPISTADCLSASLDPQLLVNQGILRQLSDPDLFMFNTFNVPQGKAHDLLVLASRPSQRFKYLPDVCFNSKNR